MPRLIVVPLDGSRVGEQVLPLAVDLATRQRAGLELVHVFDALPPYLVQGAPPFDPALDMELRHDRQKYLERVAERLRVAAHLDVTCRMLDGTDVVATLADYLGERRADLAILATHGHGGFSKLWLGSVPEGLMRHSTVPILLVRATHAAAPNEAPQLRRILVPLDLISMDEEVLDEFVAIAAPGPAEFFLLNVREPVSFFEQDALTPNDVPEYDVDSAKIERYATSELAAATEDHLEQVAARIRSRGFAVTAQVVVDHSPANAILEFADAWKMDLIVLTPQSPASARKLLPGRTTDKVVRGAHIPVLIYRRPSDRDRGVPTTVDTAAKPWG